MHIHVLNLKFKPFGAMYVSDTDLVEMFHIARSLAFIVNERTAQDTHSEAQTIADVWARSIVRTYNSPSLDFK